MGRNKAKEDRMAAKVKVNRGDIALGNKNQPENGQLFISYVNKISQLSEGHSYSEGQIWAKMPGNENYTELANARSLDALSFKGFITDDFNGNFAAASEITQPAFRHCHVGDFWIMAHTDLENFKIPLYKGDILLITNTVYAPVANSDFRENLQDVDYIRIPLSNVDKLINLSTSDLEETIQDLDLSLRYKGVFDSLQEFYNLTKKRGNLYVATKPLSIVKVHFVSGSVREEDSSDFINLKVGDMIWFNGTEWEILPTGQDAESVLYTPDKAAIDAVVTFEDWQKELLKNVDTVKQALDLLATTKAQLDETGRIPYAQLPEALRNSLSLQGKFYPIDYEIHDGKDNPDSQNPWPTTEPATKMQTGFYWIVDCEGHNNVQYVDSLNPDRVVELNTNDWIVWVEQTGRFEVIDNSDRIASLDVIDSETGKKSAIKGNVNILGKGAIKVQAAADNTIVFDGEAISEVQEGSGTKGRIPVFTGKDAQIADSELLQNLDTITALLNFQVGLETDSQNLDAFGNLGIHKTVGATPTTFVNNFLYFDTAALLKEDNKIFYRKSNVHASDRRNFAVGDEVLDIDLPEASSLLVGILKGDVTTPDYHTKVNHDGFITDSLTSEILKTDKYLDENYEDGFENVGIGRTTTEDTDTGEITFFAKTKDDKGGFYTQLHSYINENSFEHTLKEHFLNREANARTHLVINPTVLEDEIETFVKMPMVSGTLLTWEELYLAFGGGHGTPLMIPAWEEMNFRHGKLIGLDTSPITIRLNRPAHDNVSVERKNDLAEVYGDGKESAYSYIDSNKEGSIQDKKRTSKDDIVTFDAWFESQRAVASKEAFILPATSTCDGRSNLDVDMQLTEDPEKEAPHTGYGKDVQGGKYQRILPSRTLYKHEAVYYDPITGALLPQDVTTKDVEMPAVGGVILTSRSRIEGGVWL